MFVTTAEFLPQHRRQLEQTRTLIDQADRDGHQRIAEMNRTVEKNLLAIVDGLTTACSGSCGQSCGCNTKSTPEDSADAG
jgi:hypothetical protein